MSTTINDEDFPRTKFLSRKEGRALFDQRARELVGMSGNEFLKCWDRGDWKGKDCDDYPEVLNLWMLMPFVGRDLDAW